MKRKILSLALALMMIVSVAAALPVSAVEAGNAFELEMTSATTGWTTIGNVFPSTYAPSNSDDLPSWVKTGAFAMYRGGSPAVSKDIEVTAEKAGYYDLSLAYSNVLADSKVSVHLIANGKPFDRRNFTITTTGGYETSDDRAAGIANVAISTINGIYLPEGTITVKFATTVPSVTEYGDGSAWGDALPLLLYDAHLEASSSQSPVGRFSVIAADDFSAGTGGNSGNLSKTPADDFGWIPAAAGFLFHTNTSDDVTYNVYAPATGYYNLYLAGSKYSNAGIYSLFVNGAETANRTDIVISTPSSTADTDAQVSPAIATKLNAGLNTIRLKSTVSAKGDYFYGFKLAYAGESLKDIFLNPAGGTKSNANYIFGVSTEPTYDGMTWGAGNGGIYHYNAYTSSMSYTLNLDESEAGLYAVYVAVGNTSTTTTGSATVGDSTTGKQTIVTSGARTTAKEMHLGNVNIPAGSQTIKFEYTVKSSHLNIYDIKLSKLETYNVTATANPAAGGTITGAGEFVEGESTTLTATANSGYLFEGWYEGSTLVSADATLAVNNVTADKSYTAKFTAGAFLEPLDGTIYSTPGDYVFATTTTPTYQDMTWGDGEADGRYFWNGYTSGLDYTLNFPEANAGYYNVYIAAGNAATAKATATVGDSTTTEIVTVTGARGTAAETNLGRIYIPAGEQSLALRFEVGSEKLNVYDIMLKYSDDQSKVVSPIILNGNDMTFIGTGTYTSKDYAATTNNTNWASSTGMHVMVAKSGVRLQTTLTPVESGWYSVAAAYGTDQTDADLLVVIDGTSANLYSAAPYTGSRKTVGEVSMGNVYLEKGVTYTVDTYVQAALSSWSVALYGVKFEYMSSAPTEVVINGSLPTDGSYIEKQLITYAPSDNTVSWASFGSLRINGDGQWAEYKIYVPAAGYYTVNVASGAFAGNTPLVGLVVNGDTITTASKLNTPTSDLSNNLLDMSETVIARVNLNAGENTIRINGVSQSTAQRLFNIKLEREDLPTAYDVRIVDAGDNELSTVTGGSRIFAEVALPEGVEGAEIFLAQYKGSGDEKTLVKTSRVGEANVAIYSANGLNFCRTSLTTDAVAGSVKAFLWTADGNYIPLAAFDVATVQ